MTLWEHNMLQADLQSPQWKDTYAFSPASQYLSSFILSVNVLCIPSFVIRSPIVSRFTATTTADRYAKQWACRCITINRRKDWTSFAVGCSPSWRMLCKFRMTSRRRSNTTTTTSHLRSKNRKYKHHSLLYFWKIVLIQMHIFCLFLIFSFRENFWTELVAASLHPSQRAVANNMRWQAHHQFYFYMCEFPSQCQFNLYRLQ